MGMEALTWALAGGPGLVKGGIENPSIRRRSAEFGIGKRSIIV
jgi:hypothetical protein